MQCKGLTLSGGAAVETNVKEGVIDKTCANLVVLTPGVGKIILPLSVYRYLRYYTIPKPGF
jgi:hypothetical protein